MKYRVRLDEDGREEIEAACDADAIATAIELAHDSDVGVYDWHGWSRDTPAVACDTFCRITVHRIEEDENEEIYSQRVRVARGRDGEPDCPVARNHEWIDVNSYMTSGTEWLFISRCEHCGSVRRVREDKLSHPPRHSFEWAPPAESEC